MLGQLRAALLLRWPGAGVLFGFTAARVRLSAKPARGLSTLNYYDGPVHFSVSTARGHYNI